MRIDEIDIYGDFKLNGLTGNTGQFLGMSGSQLYWLDAGASTGGVSIYGTRYVYCESVTYSATMSGEILKNAYASASSIGGLSVDDRAVVLISPGVYDFLNSPLNITDSYIDLVGINSSADSVRLEASNANYVIEMIGGNIDMGLYNLSIGTASLYNVNGAGGDYQRWGNVINYGNMFTDNSATLADLLGEFRNIKVYDSVYSFSILGGNFDGTFDNIIIYTNGDSTFGQNGGLLRGTFSNITINGIMSNYAFYGYTEFNVYMKNIKINSTGLAIYSAQNLLGNYEDIEIKNCSSAFRCESSDFNGTFKNITIGTASQEAFLSSNGIIGTFSNINISFTNNFFYAQTQGSIQGTFENITVNELTAYAFVTDSGTISGTFENIKLPLAGAPHFKTFIDGDIVGTFKNIELGDGNSTDYFWSSQNLIGTFSNIKIGSVDGTAFHSSGVMSGTYEDIEIVEVIGNLFYSTDQMNGTFKNITCGTVATAFMYSEGPIGSSFSNIKVGNVGLSSFFSDYSIDATATDITVGEVGSNIFSNNTGGISGYFENIYVKSILSTAFFSTGDYLYGTFKDIYLGSSTDCLIFSVASGPIDGTFQNIELFMGGVGGTLFTGSSITGIFDNITNNLFTRSAPAINLLALFETGGGQIIGTFSNLYLGGPLSSAFSTVGNDAILVTFKNVNISIASGSIFDGAIVIGLIEKSTIYGRIQLWSSGRIVDSSVYANFLPGALDVIYLTGASTTTIERCKFIGNSDVSTNSINGFGNAQISYTLTNKGISTVTNLIGTPSNIDDANIV